MLFARLLIVGAVLFLAGCQTQGTYGESSPFLRIPVGSRLVVKEPVTVPPRTWDALFQYGALAEDRKFFDWDTHCRLTLKRMSGNEPVTIEPGEFFIYRVEDYVDPFTAARKVHVALASGALGLVLGEDAAGGGGWVRYRTNLFLRSETQPDVDKLECSHIDDPWDGDFDSIQNIRAALGDTFSLELNFPASRTP